MTPAADPIGAARQARHARELIVLCARACEHALHQAARARMAGNAPAAQEWSTRAGEWSARAFRETRYLQEVPA